MCDHTPATTFRKETYLTPGNDPCEDHGQCGKKMLQKRTKISFTYLFSAISQLDTVVTLRRQARYHWNGSPTPEALFGITNTQDRTISYHNIEAITISNEIFLYFIFPPYSIFPISLIKLTIHESSVHGKKKSLYHRAKKQSFTNSNTVVMLFLQNSFHGKCKFSTQY